MEPVSLKDLLEAGCHFGHRTERWHPKAGRFIYDDRDGIHIIDLAKTKEGLENAAKTLQEAAAAGQDILFVGTKRQAKTILKEQATRIGAHFLTERWIGGFLTNWDTIHKNLEKIRKMEEEEKSGAWKKFPKHEQLKLSRYLGRTKMVYGGVISLYDVPKVLVVLDIRKEKAAVEEAKIRGIVTIGIVDTNADPTQVDFPIPANDDAVGSITFITNYLTRAYEEGRKQFDVTREKEAQEMEKKKKEAEKKAEAPKKVVEEKPVEPKAEESKTEKPAKAKKA